MSLKWKGLKIVAMFVLFFFSWTFAGMFDLAYAVDKLPKATKNAQQAQPPKPEVRFQKAIEEIEGILEEPSTETKVAKVKTKRAEINELDKEIKKQFAETEKKLKDAGLPDEILQRHHKFVKHYADNFNELKANLDAIEKTKGLAVEVEIEKVKKHLQRVKPPKRHIPLDPNKLPHRTPKIEKREPRLKKEDFERDFLKPQKAEAQREPILVASNGSLKGLLSSNDEQDTANLIVAQATNQPAAGDLAETIEVQFTPEIIAKAQELGNNPVKIYEWVRNNIEFVPTYGSIQGAQMTLLTKQGNAFDTASLLIALLRASNLPARYVYGTMEVPIDKVMNWVGGFTDAKSAVDFIASGGIPVTAGISGGKITDVWMEHVWVEAFVDYIPSRGAVNKEGDTWIPMDGSFKQYINGRGVDLYSSLSFNGIQFMNGYITDLEDITPYQFYGRQMLTWLDANMPEASLEDILGAQDIFSINVIKQQTFPFLSATLPYKVMAQGGAYPQLSDNLRHKITIAISDDLSGGGLTITKTLPEISGKRITLSYIPATPGDEGLVAQYGGDMLKVPSYLLNVKPVVKLDGLDTAMGSAIGIGATQTLAMTFISPSIGTDVVHNRVTAGAYSAITIQPQKTPAEEVSTGMAKLINNSKNLDAVDLDDLLGELLYDIGLFYFHRVTFENDLHAKTFQMVYLKYPSEAITTLDINVTYLFGIPYSVGEDGLKIDVDRDIYNIASLAGDKNRNKQFMIISGMTSSAWENRILEAFFDTPSVSAIKLLKYANEQGIPVHTINSSNIDQLLPTLQVSSMVKTEIQNAINAGKEVIISQSELTYYEWSGVGYIVLDPTTGVGAYMISGGLAGGGTSKKVPLSLRLKSIYTAWITVAGRTLVQILAILSLYTPYVWGAETSKCGFDCSGFVHYLFTTVYGEDVFDGERLSAWWQHDYLVKKRWTYPYSERVPGDILWQVEYGHTGIYFGSDGVVHASGRRCKKNKDGSFAEPVPVQPELPEGCWNEIHIDPATGEPWAICGKYRGVVLTSVNDPSFKGKKGIAPDIGRPLP